ncbi:hypothetical protein FOCG_06517 [Fusarium oxysporum f. sp. radicis-lycopersici 26381]|uniref:Uncharacterized protein n=3 Tax=Fusarium oxysporum TaxID=5507 RepID=W9J3X1_FUSOX|nr:hypothetical protein FOYG_01245 [Fusarium oxysporum NRRL 32931]EWZ47777.1 hypothetical protein FOZG_03577 [Fusarium oxysporum Fo47]EWZ92826.1 hypothetical protein FOWG_05817 [Fusarium oxysporum f. sp. lycopersici MN25]EXK45103.1 hypothetical protein FOMG_03653 [Fusarium oxysporum f. sp. melonis 26406]EXL53106.1 hypothetical protein FOCG_06517 [Fusarium oxysporum f. sp. radicis-lycopersici 26381]
MPGSVACGPLQKRNGCKRESVQSESDEVKRAVSGQNVECRCGRWTFYEKKVSRSRGIRRLKGVKRYCYTRRRK